MVPILLYSHNKDDGDVRDDGDDGGLDWLLES